MRDGRSKQRPLVILQRTAAAQAVYIVSLRPFTDLPYSIVLPPSPMDPSLFYAITGAGITAVLLVFQLSRRVHRFLQDSVLIFLFRHVVYPLCINRHTLVGPWSRGVVLLQAFYWAATLFCSCFQIQSLPEAATRTGILSLINLVPLYLGFQLSFVADILGVSLRLWRHLHGTLGVIAVVLALVHVSISLATDRGILQGRKGLYTILVRSVSTQARLKLIVTKAGSSLLTVVVLSIRILRHPSYEIFLRLHQALAFLSLYAIWRHIHSQKMLPRLYITIAVGSFLITSVVQWIMILYRNFSFRDGCCRALITRRNGAVRINIRLPRPLYLRAGQYINIWIPSISFWSFLQSHPFTIVSWTDGQPMFVDLLVEPKSGFTNRLMQYARDSSLEAPSVEDYSASDFRIVWFSGPHGSSTNVGEFGSVLLVATDFGIAAQLPVLKELISGFNRCEVRTRRIHLVWQLRAWGKVTSLLDAEMY